MKYAWIVPAILSAAFFAFTLSVVVNEGLFGFLTEHTRSGWGLQIGLDLLLCGGVALSFGTHLARRHGVTAWPFVVATLLTGSVGLLAFAARLLHARYHAASPKESRAGAALAVSG